MSYSIFTGDCVCVSVVLKGTADGVQRCWKAMHRGPDLAVSLVVHPGVTLGNTCLNYYYRLQFNRTPKTKHRIKGKTQLPFILILNSKNMWYTE